MQLRAEALSCNPVGYYHSEGPLGQLFARYNDVNANWNIGVIGLGSGVLSAYAKPAQHWTFYELNPAVVDIARNPDYFSYLQDCATNYDIQVGDARLVLERDVKPRYNLLVVDAFTSDSIPTHLMTREALQLYFANLQADGVLAFHISNRHLALKNVLSVHARDLGLSALIQEYRNSEKQAYIHSSDWVVLAKTPEALKPLQSESAWRMLAYAPDMPSWTDDFTSIVSVWK
jgi:spermidine synthase